MSELLTCLVSINLQHVPEGQAKTGTATPNQRLVWDSAGGFYSLGN
jgi:hypothetical protein